MQNAFQVKRSGLGFHQQLTALLQIDAAEEIGTQDNIVRLANLDDRKRPMWKDIHGGCGARVEVIARPPTLLSLQSVAILPPWPPNPPAGLSAPPPAGCCWRWPGSASCWASSASSCP